jgi:hypothetical protein
VGAANDQEIHHALFPATAMIRRTCRENRLRLRRIRQQLSPYEAKVLNLRHESKHRVAVILLAIAQKKFIIRLHLVVPQKRFRSAEPRYADK